jgi:hypothetical protein
MRGNKALRLIAAVRAAVRRRHGRVSRVYAFDFTFVILLEERHGSHHTKGTGILSDQRGPEDDVMDIRVLLAGATGAIGKRLQLGQLSH